MASSSCQTKGRVNGSMNLLLILIGSLFEKFLTDGAFVLPASSLEIALFIVPILCAAASRVIPDCLRAESNFLISAYFGLNFSGLPDVRDKIMRSPGLIDRVIKGPTIHWIVPAEPYLAVTISSACSGRGPVSQAHFRVPQYGLNHIEEADE